MKTRKEWFNNLPKEAKDFTIANSTEEQLNTEKPSLYDALCDPDGFNFYANPGYEYWMKVAGDVWAAENPEAVSKPKHNRQRV